MHPLLRCKGKVFWVSCTDYVLYSIDVHVYDTYWMQTNDKTKTKLAWVKWEQRKKNALTKAKPFAVHVHGADRFDKRPI